MTTPVGIYPCDIPGCKQPAQPEHTPCCTRHDWLLCCLHHCWVHFADAFWCTPETHTTTATKEATE